MKKSAAPDVSRFSAELLNEALDMSLEWGANWLAPINARISEARPELSSADAATLQAWCVAVRELAYALVASEYGAIMDGHPATAMQQVKQMFPQLSDENLAHLHSQGMYYAWHG